METLPILKSLRRNKIGALLLVLQIAVSLAVMSNCLSIIQDNLAQMRRPTGVRSRTYQSSTATASMM